MTPPRYTDSVWQEGARAALDQLVKALAGLKSVGLTREDVHVLVAHGFATSPAGDPCSFLETAVDLLERLYEPSEEAADLTSAD